jgi:hypothetical protein
MLLGNGKRQLSYRDIYEILFYGTINSPRIKFITANFYIDNKENLREADLLSCTFNAFGSCVFILHTGFNMEFDLILCCYILSHAQTTVTFPIISQCILFSSQ